MTKNRKMALAGIITVLIAVVSWLTVLDSNDSDILARDESLAWFQSGAFEVGVATIPATPRVGESELIVRVRLANGDPANNVEVSAYAEMPAMGSMPAMRAPADLVETTSGQFEGAVNLRMRGAWPLTLSIADSDHGSTIMTFDLATDRAGLRIATGGAPIGASGIQQNLAKTIIVDSRRRQLIGLETSTVTHHDLTKTIRAIGRVTYDERLLTRVTLKYDAWISELEVNYVGAPVTRGQRMFSIYSPELLSAQQEYLAARKRLSRRSTDDSLLNAARQRLKLWDLSDNEISALEVRGTPREYVPIYSPADGIVVGKHIDDGSAAKKGQTLLRIADLRNVWIEAEVYEADLDLIREGMNATITLPYLPDRTFTAVVDYIYPYLNKASRTSRLRLTLDNADGALKPDMYAEVMLSANIGHRLAVPEDAVLFAGESRVVFVDLGGGQLKPVRIKTGQHAGGMIEVTEGLVLGDVIVTSGNFLIAAETKLKAGIDQW
ncbi:MAG: efflux RND transporter periplasmic adaptor subunit [Proteobacteria bacterium]|nr:efflux RND transporter periplasmic adaptor subunit [Pseudomonadota bacterium]